MSFVKFRWDQPRIFSIYKNLSHIPWRFPARIAIKLYFNVNSHSDVLHLILSWGFCVKYRDITRCLAYSLEVRWGRDVIGQIAFAGYRNKSMRFTRHCCEAPCFQVAIFPDFHHLHRPFLLSHCSPDAVQRQRRRRAALLRAHISVWRHETPCRPLIPSCFSRLKRLP